MLECAQDGERLRILGAYGAGTLTAPHGLALADERLYVADPPAHRVFAVDHAADPAVDAAVTAIAGTGEQGRGYPRSAAPAGAQALSLPDGAVTPLALARG